MEIAQLTVNFMANKISKGPKSINTGTKFPQHLRNLTPSTLLSLFPRSRVPVPAADFLLLAYGNMLLCNVIHALPTLSCSRKDCIMSANMSIFRFLTQRGCECSTFPSGVRNHSWVPLKILSFFLQDFKECDRVRCVTAHVWVWRRRREDGSESAGSNNQPSPILKGQKSWKGFIGTLKKTRNRCYISLIKEIITSHQ